jgi:hypothetical protein
MDVIEIDPDGFVYAKDEDEQRRKIALVKAGEFQVVRRSAPDDYSFRFLAWAAMSGLIRPAPTSRQLFEVTRNGVL